MRKLVPFAIALAPLSILMSKWIWQFSMERYLISALSPENLPFTDPWHLVYMCLQIMADYFLILSSLIWFTIREPLKRDKWFYIIRSFFIMHFIFRIPALIVTFLNFQPGWDNEGGYLALIYSALKLFIVFILLKFTPSGNTKQVKLTNYPMYEASTKKERALHHVTDITLFIATSATWLGRVEDDYPPELLVAIAITIIIFYFLYFFLAEAILGQTPGQSLTNSCPAGTHSPMSARKALLRSLSRLIPFDSFSFLWGKNWHDRISGTTVVRRNSWKDISFEGER